MIILKMVMERFNLQFYTDSLGVLHLDTYQNMLSGETLLIDHLINEDINVEYTQNDNGIISVRDSNPSFYDEKFNLLDKFVVSEEKRDEISLSFQSAIVGKKMYEDVYDGSGYDLLKWVNQTNFWGTADRRQVEPKDLKPMFSFVINGNNTPVYMPITYCTYAAPLVSENYFIEQFIKYMDIHLFRIFPDKEDAKTTDAIMELFKRREDLDIFNKSLNEETSSRYTSYSLRVWPKTDLGMTHVYDERFEDNYIRLPLGGFFNHSEKPNCKIIEVLMPFLNLNSEKLTVTFPLNGVSDAEPASTFGLPAPTPTCEIIDSAIKFLSVAGSTYFSKI